VGLLLKGGDLRGEAWEREKRPAPRGLKKKRFKKEPNAARSFKPLFPGTPETSAEG